MDITITGKQIDVGDALREHVEERVRTMIAKYFDRPTDAAVTVSREAHLFTCDCMTHLSTGLTAQASAEHSDVYAACDAAVARLEKQLRRYKRRLKDHHRRRKGPVAQVEATAYLLSGDDDAAAETSLGDEPADGASAGGVSADGLATDDALVAEEASAAAFWAPTIVAESAAKLPSLSVGEAVMQLDLSNAPFLLFWNDARGRVNLVYYRDDGHIGWIDPKPTA